jgi:threonine synthase
MWRYHPWLPLTRAEEPVSLGEGCTPLLPLPGMMQTLGLSHVWMKDEGQNPCGSFKVRGLAVAVTRAVLAGATRFVLPTAGNAGVATAAYGTRAGVPVRIYAPRTTPPTLLAQMRHFGADLHLIDGHIGDCGKEAKAYAEATGATNLSTLQEPYRVEGKKTLGLEIAEQLGWKLPNCLIYPTGGGTGLIGMWKAFQELLESGWIHGPMPRLFSVQAEGCAPVVHAFKTGATSTEAWPDPMTSACGLRVPNPLGGKLMLSALRQSGGGAIAVSEEAIQEDTAYLMQQVGIDAAPEGGATLAALRQLVAEGVIQADESVVLFNTGAGWLYR